MIANIKSLEKYCIDYTNIENYDTALTSPLRYDLHHRREISENKSRKQLIADHLYFDRPPQELIFLEHGAHTILHKAGKQLSTETKQKISENNCRYWKDKNLSKETKRKMSDAKKGEKCYMYGKPKSEETRRKISENNCRYWRGKPGTCLGKHWHLENGKRVYTD